MITFEDKALSKIGTLVDHVLVENRKQLEKWGIQNCSPIEWMLWLTEEVGELAQAVAEHVYRGGSIEDVFKEAIQVATLSLKIAEGAMEGNQ
jgi:NTP pyrophosphatase (non-canonical NTP hydrolase)